MTIRWAMIGTGRVQRSMAPAIKEAKDTRLVAVLGSTQDKATAFAGEYGIERAYDLMDELIRDPEVDVVYVAGPNGLHASHTIQAAKAGKHVFCEKPMALTLEDCHSMIEACRKNGVKLGLGLQYRHHPAHLKAREIVTSGELGALVFANAQVEIPPESLPKWYYEPRMSGGGAMHMLGTHRIDLLRFILKCEVEEVSAFIGEPTKEKPFEEMVVGMLKFDKGAYGTVHFSMNIPHGANSFEVHGTRASLFCIGTTSQWWGGGGGELILKGDSVTTTYPFKKPYLYREEVEDFNRSIQEDKEPRATGMDGLRSAEISIALFESGLQRKTIRIEDLRGPVQLRNKQEIQ